MKYVVLIGALAASIAVPAQAQQFSGFRIEARGGWEEVEAKATYPNPDDDDDVDGDEFLSGSESDSAISYGIELGYDVDLGSNVVLGAYAGLDFSDAGQCSEVVGDDLVCADTGRNFTIGVRAGVPLGDTALLYAKGGYSNGRLEASYDEDLTDNDDATPGAVAQVEENFDGYHVGGGVEFALGGGLYAKAEYLYTDYGSRSFLLDEIASDPTLRIGSNRHQATVGVGIRF